MMRAPQKGRLGESENAPHKAARSASTMKTENVPLIGRAAPSQGNAEILAHRERLSDG
jgi:hypothetical protein